MNPRHRAAAPKPPKRKTRTYSLHPRGGGISVRFLSDPKKKDNNTQPAPTRCDRSSPAFDTTKKKSKNSHSQHLT